MGVTDEQFKKDREELILETEESSMAVIEDILELYVLCINDIQKELQSFVTKYGKDNIIPYTETRRRLTDKERSTFNTELKAWYREVRENEMDNAYRENLQSLGKRKYITRMEYLQANLRYHVEKLFFKIEQKLFPFFKDVYTYSYYIDTYRFLKNMGISAEIFDIDDTDIINSVNSKYANTTFKLSLNKNKTALLREFETTIPQSIARGFSIKKLDDIVNMKTAASRNRSIALTRTETNYLCNKATLDYYKSIGVEKYEFLATLDMRTSDMCRDMDGYIGNVSQAEPGVNFPPIHVNCYDKDTEVYTNQGWKKFKDLNYTELFWSINPDTLEPEWVSAKNYIAYNYKGNMVEFKNKTFNLCVTPNHNLFLKYNKKDGRGKYRFVEADKSPKYNNNHYRGCVWKGVSPETIKLGNYAIPISLYCKFMGYYLSEGSFISRDKNNGWKVSIAQEKYNDIFYNDLRNLPIKINRSSDCIYFSDKSIYEYVQQFGRSHEKYVPDTIKNLSSYHINEFLEAFRLGDGSYTYNGTWDEYRGSYRSKFFTSSIRLRDDLGELIMKAGGHPSFKLLTTKGTYCFDNKYTTNNDVWGIYWCTNIHASVDYLPKNYIPYNDMVYCVELEKYHTLLVKRKGQVVWCGNCRSTTIPYIENLSKFGDRVARDASGRTIKVPRRMTQEEYINKYVPEKYRSKLLKFKNSYRPKIDKK